MSKAAGFSFQPTADGRVRIFHHGWLAATLAKTAASKFLEKARAAGEEELQLLMARATGKYKHGNEWRIKITGESYGAKTKQKCRF